LGEWDIGYEAVARTGLKKGKRAFEMWMRDSLHAIFGNAFGNNTWDLGDVWKMLIIG
jgi:hypothetical protein